ncbi:MAG: cob(I)yrinic acid a,c-diamide adenosyltransferase, partial [Candidatus Thorarchaeota archaeon]
MDETLTSGLVQVYTGNGKGKTTCALGAGLRAAGHGLDVIMICFMKAKIAVRGGDQEI